MGRVIIILSLFITLTIFANNQKMPGSYIAPVKDDLKIVEQIGIRVDPKPGAYETYFIDNESLGPTTMTFMVILDSEGKKWLELDIDSERTGKYQLKILHKERFMGDDFERLQLKFQHYQAFELPINDTNKDLMKEQALIKNVKSKLKEEFVKKDMVKIKDKEFEISQFRVTTNSGVIEYSLLKEEDSAIFGITLLKTKDSKLILKEFGFNAVSNFPSKVPVLGIIGNLGKMSDEFIKQEKEREKAEEEERALESSTDDDTIDKLNQMMKDKEK
ncbi:hypothetical protein JXR93_05760 [bacterium]|nr:hypothetical protein [bacterium]